MIYHKLCSNKARLCTQELFAVNIEYYPIACNMLKIIILYTKGFSFECQFNNGNDCGYAATPESNSQWSVIESHTFTIDGTETTGKKIH